MSESTAFAIQHLDDWLDYPEWREYEEWLGEGKWRPVRFATREAAQAHIDTLLAEDYADKVQRYEEAEAKNKPHRERYQCRLALLEAHGLGKQPDETFHPLVMRSSGVTKPKPPNSDNWRVVAESELTDDD